MIYVIVAIFVIGCLATCGLSRINRKALFTSCPCVALGTVLTAVALFLSHKTAAAYIVLAAGLFVSILLLSAVRRQAQME
jgi:hypothetical protein